MCPLHRRRCALRWRSRGNYGVLIPLEVHEHKPSVSCGPVSVTTALSACACPVSFRHAARVCMHTGHYVDLDGPRQLQRHVSVACATTLARDSVGPGPHVCPAVMSDTVAALASATSGGAAGQIPLERTSRAVLQRDCHASFTHAGGGGLRGPRPARPGGAAMAPPYRAAVTQSAMRSVCNLNF